MCGGGKFEGGRIYLGYYGATLYVGDRCAKDRAEVREILKLKTKKELIEMFESIIESGSDE